VTFTVAAEVTERLDRFLADQLDLSRTQAARLVAAGRVTVDGTAARASRLLTHGASVVVDFPHEEPPRTLLPHPIALSIVYEDEHLAVIDKPAGLVVHPAPGHWHDTLVNALVARGTTLSGGAAGRPGIVHRLDRDTSGLMIVAKSDLAHRRLGAMLAARKVRRAYAALSWRHRLGDISTIASG
jgi:23S rRNA pseudouridine1911/1915/1917 synthase